MSYGWNYCSACDAYRKHEECGDHRTLSCNHTAGEPNVPEWTYWFRTDDSFEEWRASPYFLTGTYAVNGQLDTLVSLMLLKRMHEKMSAFSDDECYR